MEKYHMSYRFRQAGILVTVCSLNESRSNLLLCMLSDFLTTSGTAFSTAHCPQFAGEVIDCEHCGAGLLDRPFVIASGYCYLCRAHQLAGGISPAAEICQSAAQMPQPNLALFPDIEPPDETAASPGYSKRIRDALVRLAQANDGVILPADCTPARMFEIATTAIDRIYAAEKMKGRPENHETDSFHL